MAKTLWLAAVGVVACALVIATPAEAASFDCNRARAADEVTVCRNAELSALDSEMGALWFAYSRVPLLMGGNSQRADEARAFLERRRRCVRNVPCIARAYRERIAMLRQGVDDAMRRFTELLHGSQE